MSQQDAGDLLLIEQIVALVLERLADHSTFDAETLALLRELAKSGGLVKYEQVVSTLSTDLKE